VGDEMTSSKVINALETTTYDFLGRKYKLQKKLTDDAKTMLISVPVDKINDNKNILDNSDIIIVDYRFLTEVRSKLNKFYIFNSETENDTLFEKIISENESIEHALSYNYPVFRTYVARKTITTASFINAAWVAGTALPNTIPGPHEIYTAPIEAVSDFAVLTLNETRMIFILSSVSGRRVNPITLIPEILIMLGGAKGAQMLATQIVGKVPAGAGLALKTAIAFAFTYAIGEAAYLNLNFGITFDKNIIKKRVDELKEFSEKMVNDILKKSAKEKS
jgi:hypothetical protein